MIRPTRGELYALERFDARQDLSGQLSSDVVKVAGHCTTLNTRGGKVVNPRIIEAMGASSEGSE